MYKCWWLLLVIFGLNANVRAQDFRNPDYALVKMNYEAATDKRAYLLTQTGSSDETILTFVAQPLGDNDGQQVEAALRKLMHHKMRNLHDGLLPVAGYAIESLSRIMSKPDMERVRQTHSSVEREEIVKKYAWDLQLNPAGRPNSAGRMLIREFLLEEVDHKPEEIVPLLVKYFAGPANSKLRQYAALAAPWIEQGLHSPQPGNVQGTLRLIEVLQDERFLPHFAQMLHASPRHGQIFGSSLDVRNVLRSFGNKVLPVLEQVLYSENYLAQMDAIGTMETVGAPEATAVLKRFRAAYAARPDFLRDAKLLKRLDHIIQGSKISN